MAALTHMKIHYKRDGKKKKDTFLHIHQDRIETNQLNLHKGDLSYTFGLTDKNSKALSLQELVGS